MLSIVIVYMTIWSRFIVLTFCEKSPCAAAFVQVKAVGQVNVHFNLLFHTRKPTHRNSLNLI